MCDGVEDFLTIFARVYSRASKPKFLPPAPLDVNENRIHDLCSH
jgi:hypothetical protein